MCGLACVWPSSSEVRHVRRGHVVLLALLEFALVNYAARKDMTTAGQRMLAKPALYDGYRALATPRSESRASFCCHIFVRRYKERSKRIDVVSRLV